MEKAPKDYMKPTPSLLVTAYLRPKATLRILEVAARAGIKKFFVVLDFPLVLSELNMKIHNDIVEKIDLFIKTNSELEVFIHKRHRNVGCSASILSACDWLFAQSEFGIILEDDCIPSEDFFSFCTDAEDVIHENKDVWLACGTQFAPSSFFTDSWSLSKYPMTWGWATTQGKWSEIRRSLLNPKKIGFFGNQNIGLVEAAYWNAGARRGYNGYVDAWDTPLAREMISRGKFAIAPSHSLVMNIGNDNFATHTSSSSRGLNQPIGQFLSPSSRPSRNLIADTWVRENFYVIRFRHLITTRITYLADVFSLFYRKKKRLSDRWEKAAIN